MTEVEVRQDKRGRHWWVWLILAAVLAFSFWQFFLKGQFSPASNTAAVSGIRSESFRSGSDSQPITNLDSLLTADVATIVGRQVRLSNVRTGTVPADAGFWIVGANDRREYVILHEVETPNTPIEGKIDVNQGDRLDIVGTVRSAAEGVPKGAAIPGPTAPLPAGVEHYIDAQSVVQAQ